MKGRTAPNAIGGVTLYYHGYFISGWGYLIIQYWQQLEGHILFWNVADVLHVFSCSHCSSDSNIKFTTFARHFQNLTKLSSTLQRVPNRQDLGDFYFQQKAREKHMYHTPLVQQAIEMTMHVPLIYFYCYMVHFLRHKYDKVCQQREMFMITEQNFGKRCKSVCWEVRMIHIWQNHYLLTIVLLQSYTR